MIKSHVLEPSQLNGHMEAPTGFEPATSSLPMKCTTSVLRSQIKTPEPCGAGAVVGKRGVEPLILSATVSKTVMYTSSNTYPYGRL